jgi:hypothetical protein
MLWWEGAGVIDHFGSFLKVTFGYPFLLSLAQSTDEIWIT